MDKFTGRVWVLGDDIDTDIIIPTEYLALKTIDDMKQYGFSPLRPELAGQIHKSLVKLIIFISSISLTQVEKNKIICIKLQYCSLQNDTLTLYKIKTVFYHKCSMIFFKLICQKNNKTTKKTE